MKNGIYGKWAYCTVKEEKIVFRVQFHQDLPLVVQLGCLVYHHHYSLAAKERRREGRKRGREKEGGGEEERKVKSKLLALQSYTTSIYG